MSNAVGKVIRWKEQASERWQRTEPRYHQSLSWPIIGFALTPEPLRWNVLLSGESPCSYRKQGSRLGDTAPSYCTMSGLGLSYVRITADWTQRRVNKGIWARNRLLKTARRRADAFSARTNEGLVNHSVWIHSWIILCERVSRTESAESIHKLGQQICFLFVLFICFLSVTVI